MDKNLTGPEAGFFVMNPYVKSWVWLSAFIALGVVLGYVFLAVPNVEMVTATIFICGYLMGIKYGIFCGLLTETIYGVFNPQGVAAPPLLAGMILAMALTGMAGGLTGRMKSRRGWTRFLMLGMAGFLCTLVFDLTTGFTYALGAGMTWPQLTASLFMGIPFYAIHIGVNTFIFISLVPAVLGTMNTYKKTTITVVCILFTVQASRASENEGIPARSTGIQVPAINYRHLGDLTVSLPGVWFRDLGYNGHWAGFRLSGSRSNQAEMLVNGFSMKDPVTGINDLRLIPVEMIDEPGVVSASMLTGRISSPGYLVLDTRSLLSSRPLSRAVYRTGPNRFSDLDLTFGRKMTRHFEILSGILLNNEGDESSGKHHGQQIRSSILWTPWHPVTLSYLILHNVHSSDLSYPVSFPEDSVVMTRPFMRRQRVDHMMRSTFHAADWPFQFSWHYTDLHYRLNDRLTENRSGIQGSRHEWTYEQHMPFIKAGSLFARYEIQSVQKDTLDVEKQSWESGIYNRFHLTRQLSSRIQFAVLHEQKNAVAWNGSLFWEPREKFSLRTGMARTLHEPCVADEWGLVLHPTAPEVHQDVVLLDNPDRLVRNPSMGTETTDCGDIGIHIQYSLLETDLRAFVQSSKNSIELVSAENGFMYANSGKQDNYGLETKTDIGFWHRMRGSLTLNYLHASENDRTPLERPNLWGLAVISWSHPCFEGDLDLSVVLQIRFWSEFYSLSGNTLETLTDHYHEPGQMLHGKIMARIMQNAVISLSLDNVLDTPVTLANEYPCSGRSVRIGYFWELFN